MVAFWSLSRQPVLLTESPPPTHYPLPRHSCQAQKWEPWGGSLVPGLTEPSPSELSPLPIKGSRMGSGLWRWRTPKHLCDWEPTQISLTSPSLPVPHFPPLPSFQSVQINYTSLDVYFWRIQVYSLLTLNHKTTVYFYLLTVYFYCYWGRRRAEENGVEGDYLSYGFSYGGEKKISATCFVFKKSFCHTEVPFYFNILSAV